MTKFSVDQYYIMNLKDGGVIAIDTGYDYISGCPTCDWGAERTNYVKIELTNLIIEFILTQTYDYPFETYKISLSDLVKLFAIQNPENMTQNEFVLYIVEKITKEYSRFSVRITSRGIMEDSSYNDGKWEQKDFYKED